MANEKCWWVIEVAEYYENRWCQQALREKEILILFCEERELPVSRLTTKCADEQDVGISITQLSPDGKRAEREDIRGKIYRAASALQDHRRKKNKKGS
ncbi:MAG: hypothetical protein ACOYS2_03280 [Patescibacteria group bacterium]